MDPVRKGEGQGRGDAEAYAGTLNGGAYREKSGSCNASLTFNELEIAHPGNGIEIAVVMEESGALLKGNLGDQ